MASHKLLMLVHLLIKNEQMCMSKKQKLQREAQCGQAKDTFKPTHSDVKAKIVTCFRCHLSENPCKYMQFPSQVDYAKSKQSSTMQTGVKMAAQKNI